MIGKVNLEAALNEIRDERMLNLEGNALLRDVNSLFEAEWEKDKRIASTLEKGVLNEDLLNGAHLAKNRKYNIEDIRKLCVKYRLRFLSTKHFNNTFPLEAMSAIKETEKQCGQEIKAYMIAAPSHMFKLTDANSDPLLFAPTDDGKFYLIHQWGGDMSKWRRIRNWPAERLKNLVISIFVLSIVLSAVLPSAWLSPHANHFFNFYRLAFFVWNLAFFSGMVSYFWFATNQKFSVTAWNSKHFN